MVALDRQGTYTELPAFNLVEVRDATGAGDTVAAVATLTLCAGGTLEEAAVLGNVAAGQEGASFRCRDGDNGGTACGDAPAYLVSLTIDENVGPPEVGDPLCRTAEGSVCCYGTIEVDVLGQDTTIY